MLRGAQNIDIGDARRNGKGNVKVMLCSLPCALDWDSEERDREIGGTGARIERIVFGNRSGGVFA